MSWEDYWGPAGTLEKATQVFNASERSSDNLISFALVLHSAADRARTEVQRGKVWYLTKMIQLGWKALDVVRTAWRRPGALNELLNQPDKLEVSCAIWSRWGWMAICSRNYKKCARDALIMAKWEEIARDEAVKAHTRAFLIIHAIKLRITLPHEWLRTLPLLAAETEAAGELNQAARVYKYIDQIYGVAWAKQKAEVLARPDQRTQMGLR